MLGQVNSAPRADGLTGPTAARCAALARHEFHNGFQWVALSNELLAKIAEHCGGASPVVAAPEPEPAPPLDASEHAYMTEE